MDYLLTPEEEAFKSRFHAWLEDNIPDGFLRPEYPIPEGWDERVRIYREFQRKLYEAGYAGITYPKEYGGRAGTIMEQTIVTEGLAPWVLKLGDINAMGNGMAGPTIMACGTEAQKQRFIAKLLTGEHIWCQAFSEPNAGSDLAALSTRAENEGEYYRINGQKIWTSMAHLADYCLLLARTDPKARKHKGLSYFIMDMKLPGITVRPVIQMTGEHEFNELFLDDVRIPADMLIGEEGQGWRIALTTLEFERVMGDVSIVSACWQQYEYLLEMAQKIRRQGRPASKDPNIRRKLAECFIDLMVVRHIGYRNLSKMACGERPGPEGSIGKLYWSELIQRMAELSMEIQGPQSQFIKGSSLSIDNGWWQYEFLHSSAYPIGGGTSEIQRNIIAERVLGLPRGPL